MTTAMHVNYPDVLGTITGGKRLNIDVIQCALAVRPAEVHAGRFFEAVLLIQNASDADVDVVITPDLPRRDAANESGRFSTKSTRIRVGVRPAEVGFVAVPVATSPKTAPGSGYHLGVELAIKRLGKRQDRIRAANGGGEFNLGDMPDEVQGHVEALRMLTFSTDAGGKKNNCQVPFVMLPPALASLKTTHSDWVSLWTLRDYMDEYAIAQKVWDAAQSVVQNLRRETVFMPLLKATQERFEACQYKLHPPEAIYITKLLTLVLELGVAEPTAAEPRPAWPRWFVRLCRLLAQEPALATQIEPLVTRLLYADLVYDAMLYAFHMIETVAEEEFGSAEESDRYAGDLTTALMQQQYLDFARAYFPLVLGGLIANTRVTMPREQVRETVFILSKALDKRQPEKTKDNTFIFALAKKLIERAMTTA